MKGGLLGGCVPAPCRLPDELLPLLTRGKKEVLLDDEIHVRETGLGENQTELVIHLVAVSHDLDLLARTQPIPRTAGADDIEISALLELLPLLVAGHPDKEPGGSLVHQLPLPCLFLFSSQPCLLFLRTLRNGCIDKPVEPAVDDRGIVVGMRRTDD